MIGRQNQQGQIGITAHPADILHRPGDGRCCIAANRFKQNGVLLPEFQLVYLALGDEAVILADHDNRRQSSFYGANSSDGVLQQRRLVDEAEQLLGIDFTGQRPEPGSRSSGQDHRLDCCH